VTGLARQQEPSRKVLERTTPEQRSSLYDDVRELLTPGFLSESVSINGTRLAVRSLSAADFYLLKHRAGSLDFTKAEVQHWYLATAVWMVGGQPILEDPQATPEIYEVVKDLPVGVLNELVYVTGRLQKRMEKAIGRVRAFNFESESRFLWAAFGDNPHGKSGVPGAGRLGLNPLHRMWIGFNRAEDEREQFQVEWMQTKLIAATQSPKGVKKLNQSDQAAQEREKQRRQAIMDAAFYESQGHTVDLKEVTKGGQFGGIKLAVTPEELEDEFRRWKAGIKDDHDRVVDYYKAKVAQRVEAERAEQRARIEAAQRAAEAEGFAEPSLRPLAMDAEEIRARFRTGGTSKVYYGTKANSLYERYIANEPEAGAIVMRGGQPVSVPESEAAPLNDQVRQRMLRQRGGKG